MDAFLLGALWQGSEWHISQWQQGWHMSTPQRCWQVDATAESFFLSKMPCVLPMPCVPQCYYKHHASSVMQLIRSGHTVVAAVRSAEKAQQRFSSADLKEGYQSKNAKGGILITSEGVDVTNPDTLTAELFEGVTQVCFDNTLILV